MYDVEKLSPRGHVYLVLNIVTPVAAIIAVGLRIWIRVNISKSIGMEDWLLVASLINYVGASISAVLMALFGFGAHINTISHESVLILFKSMFANGIFIYICIICLRFSICLLFLRITKVRWQRIVLYVVLAGTTIINVVNLFRINIVYCVPIPLYWTLYVGDTNGTCVSARTMSLLFYAQYGIAVLADLIHSILPIFIMKDWVLNRRGKHVTYGLLGMGIFASGVALAMIAVNPSAADTGDYTYTAYSVFVCQALEPWVGILAASFSTYRPLFRSLGDVISRKRQGGYSGGSSPESSKVASNMGKHNLSFVNAEPV